MNPLKIVNSASFGIPTIAYDEPCFKEVHDCYTPCRNLEELLENLDSFIKAPHIYQGYSFRCLRRSEKYHISKIAELYRRLT